MDSWNEPLERLGEQVAWFARAKELRVLSVRTSAELRVPALKLIAGAEYHPDNRSPLLFFEDAAEDTELGWDARTERLRLGHRGRSQALAEAGIELGAWTMPEWEGGELARFGASLRAYLSSLREPLEGLVLVLAPTRIGDPDRWSRDIRALLERPELGAVRLILVDQGEADYAALLAELGNRALQVECVIDPAAEDADLRALTEGIDPEAAGSAILGAAWPHHVIAPTRARAARIAGTQPSDREAPADETGVLSRLLFSAAMAMREGRSDEAIEQQMEARDLAARLDRIPELLLIEMTLGGYLLSAGHHEAAYAAYAAAAMWAEEAELPEREAQARLALGLLLATEGRTPEACAEYGAAAAKAEEAGNMLLAIEGWRIAGQLAAELDLEEQCVGAWSEALRIAGERPDLARASSATEIGRALARVLRRLGLVEQAEAVEALTERLTKPAPTLAPALAVGG